ncbi:Protease HtpX [Candidatus Lokiarchaeum ossiferum]|uniref:Protease HtpX n=1 Tax=Candidatus Lokiarchaeum ossiferum TaxID=2951803 RepID=A0ABY6HPW5_9ARCH|nr:Protease HtpX [Candidatus Lokiarchaeum sp. B-35]
MGYKFRSTLTIGLLYGMLFVLILAVDFFLPDDIYIFSPLMIAILSCIGIFFQYLISPLIIGWIYRIEWVDYNRLEQNDPHIAQLIQNVCQKYNFKLPKFGVIHGGTPNAFTYGWTRNSARLVITDGILELLNAEEQRAVVAHELGHIEHNDFIVMTFVSAIPVMFYTIFRLLTNSYRYRRFTSVKPSRGSSDDNKYAQYILLIKIGLAIVSYIMYIVGYFLSLFISRLREYYADEFSGKETADPNSLATALVKIAYGILQEPEKGQKTFNDKNQYVKALGIFDKNSAKNLAYSATNGSGKIDNTLLARACAWDLYQPWAKFAEITSTHPLPAKRIKQLSYMSFKEFKKPPKVDLSQAKVEFEKQMGKSALDEFFGELLIYIMPKLIFWTWLIVGGILFIANFDITTFSPLFNGYWSFMVFSLVLAGIFQLIQNAFKYKSGFKEHKIVDLIGTIKVSPIRPVPTITKGFVIGRGVPGLFWSEDVVVRDEKGIMFIDYDFGIGFINTLFGIFKAEKLKGKDVEITGWYRRNPSPYIQVHKIKLLDGSGKSFGNYKRAFWQFVGIFLIALGGILWFLL